MKSVISTYLLCLFSLGCPIWHHYATKRVRIPIFYNTSVDPYHYTPYIHGYIDGEKHPISLRLDTGSSITVLKHQNLQNQVKKNKNRTTVLHIKLDSYPKDLSINALIAAKRWSGGNTIGERFFQSQSTVLFTKKMLYLNVLIKGINRCGNFKNILTDSGKLPVRGHRRNNTPIFYISVNGKRVRTMFDSGTSLVLLHTSLINGEPISKMHVRLFNGPQLVNAQLGTVNARVIYKDKNKANLATTIHFHDPHVLNMNTIGLPKGERPEVEYIIGWPFVAMGLAYYINNPLGQQCFISQSRVLKLLKSVDDTHHSPQLLR